VFAVHHGYDSFIQIIGVGRGSTRRMPKSLDAWAREAAPRAHYPARPKSQVTWLAERFHYLGSFVSLTRRTSLRALDRAIINMATSIESSCSVFSIDSNGDFLGLNNHSGPYNILCTDYKTFRCYNVSFLTQHDLTGTE